jgi:hypothetical protein
MIEVLKQALEALELALRSHGVMLLSDPPQDAWKTYGVEGNARQAITSLRQAIAELESQEPVAWMHVQGNYEEPSFRQLADDEVERGWEQYPLYTHPPQRSESFGKPSAWVGLTDEELDEWTPEIHDVIRAIEAKLKQKNGFSEEKKT